MLTGVLILVSLGGLAGLIFSVLSYEKRLTQATDEILELAAQVYSYKENAKQLTAQLEEIACNPDPVKRKFRVVFWTDQGAAARRLWETLEPQGTNLIEFMMGHIIRDRKPRNDGD